MSHSLPNTFRCQLNKREGRDAYVYLVFHVSRDRVKDTLGTMGFLFAP